MTNLDNLTSEGGGRGVHMALAFLLNEAVEMPRFLFVAGTLKPVDWGFLGFFWMSMMTYFSDWVYRRLFICSHGLRMKK